MNTKPHKFETIHPFLFLCFISEKNDDEPCNERSLPTFKGDKSRHKGANDIKWKDMKEKKEGQKNIRNEIWDEYDKK